MREPADQQLALALVGEHPLQVQLHHADRGLAARLGLGHAVGVVLVGPALLAQAEGLALRRRVERVVDRLDAPAVDGPLAGALTQTGVALAQRHPVGVAGVERARADRRLAVEVEEQVLLLDVDPPLKPVGRRRGAGAGRGAGDAAAQPRAGVLQRDAGAGQLLEPLLQRDGEPLTLAGRPVQARETDGQDRLKLGGVRALGHLQDRARHRRLARAAHRQIADADDRDARIVGLGGCQLSRAHRCPYP